jgi:predicted nucleic acid-binding protein
MNEKYYLDTCIWRDYFENRSDNFRPLGKWALTLIKKIINENDIIVYSDLIIEELSIRFTKKEITKIIEIVPKEFLIKLDSSYKQTKEAIILSKKLNIPKKDALHAILARDNNAIVITRDAHFYQLSEKVTIMKPEELI